MKWITSVGWLKCNVPNLPSVKNLSTFQCIVSRKSNTFEVGSLTYLLRCLGSFLGMVTVDHWWFSEPCGTITRANSRWGEFNHENECLMSQTQTRARAEAKLHIAWGWIEQNDHVQKNGHYLGWTCILFVNFVSCVFWWHVLLLLFLKGDMQPCTMGPFWLKFGTETIREAHATFLCMFRKKIRPTNMHFCVSELQKITYDRGELPKRSINFGDFRLWTNELEKYRSRVAWNGHWYHPRIDM